MHLQQITNRSTLVLLLTPPMIMGLLIAPAGCSKSSSNTNSSSNVGTGSTGNRSPEHTRLTAEVEAWQAAGGIIDILTVTTGNEQMNAITARFYRAAGAAWDQLDAHGQYPDPTTFGLPIDPVDGQPIIYQLLSPDGPAVIRASSRKKSDWIDGQEPKYYQIRIP